MIQKTFLIGTICLSFLLAATRSDAMVVVYSVDQVISFEKLDGIVIIRPCATDSLRRELMSAEGCPLIVGGQELRMNLADFMIRVNLALSTIPQFPGLLNLLSESQKKLLTNALADTSQHKADQAVLKQLENYLAELEEFKRENEHDYDAEELAKTRAAKDELKTKLEKYRELFEAQDALFKILSALLKDMTTVNGIKTFVPLKRSSDGDQLKFNLLKGVVNQ